VGRGLALASIIRMSDTAHFITHVSDTARWTALHRATESARADALFSDPLAERLAGEHGRAIVARVFVAAHRYRRLPMFMRPIAWLPQADPRRPGGSPWSTGCTPYPLSSANG
jgi:hypothetical protein